MSERNIGILEEKAKQISTLVKELEEIANQNGFGLTVYDTEVRFDDWQSSDCYGEGNGDDFTVNGEDIWYPSSC